MLIRRLLLSSSGGRYLCLFSFSGGCVGDARVVLRGSREEKWFIGRVSFKKIEVVGEESEVRNIKGDGVVIAGNQIDNKLISISYNYASRLQKY